MKRATMLGRFTEPGARLVAVAIAVGVLLVIQVIVLVWGGVLAVREGDRAVDDSFAYLADVSQERVVAYAQATQNVAIETVKSLEFQDPGVRGLADTLHGAVTSRSQVDASAAERIRARAEEALKDRFRGREGLSVTAGFAVSPDGDVDIDALIAAADAALVDGKWLKKGATYGA